MEQHKTPSNNESLFSASQICTIAGISRRQLQYWDKSGLVNPSHRTEGGHGRYTFSDLISIRAAKKLIDAGISVQRIRRSIGQLKRILPTIKRPLSELTLVATGDVILVFYEDTAFEAISGQEWILDIADVQREVDKWRKKRNVIGRFRKVKAVNERQ
ncbi:MAG: MerR family transcriptional regulator [Nitrospirae bacterium]|nr:MerR family transcriptional regulator [Nitrospirota bacterium]